VASATELQDALAAASNNAQDDTVRVKPGTYAPASGAIAFAYNGLENFALTIDGGFVDIGIMGCFFQIRDPAITVLSGSSARTVMQLAGAAGTNGDLTVRNLTFANGLSTSGTGGGLRIGVFANYTGDILVERVLFDNNVSTSAGGGLSGGSDGGTFTLRNSVFRNNRASTNHGAASIANNATSTTNYRAFVGNNTIVGNTCTPGAPPTCNVGGISLGGNSRYAVFNNALAFNAGIDLVFPDNGDLFNNNVPALSGTPDAMSGNLALVDPMLVDAGAGDFRLLFASPLRNAGTATFDPGTIDFDGMPRLNDGRYDIGAFENSAILFKDGFETQP
jgi:hypothetical protein